MFNLLVSNVQTNQTLRHISKKRRDSESAAENQIMRSGRLKTSIKPTALSPLSESASLLGLMRSRCCLEVYPCCRSLRKRNSTYSNHSFHTLPRRWSLAHCYKNSAYNGHLLQHDKSHLSDPNIDPVRTSCRRHPRNSFLSRKLAPRSCSDHK